MSTRTFTGRDSEVEQLLALAREAPGSTAAGVALISTINGMGGVGKTALAVHAAHRMRTAFPDGQLFVDLHGHTPGLAPLTPEEGLAGLLRSLGAPPQGIPPTLAERAAQYRARLADTRTLVVLDNAASTAQVRPLLPGTANCLVLITSRRDLPGLDDAHLITLDTLDHATATALLLASCGRDRLKPDDAAVAELIDLSGGLPLALRILAARLRHHRGLSPEDLMTELREQGTRVDRLHDEDRSLAAVLDSSLRTLPRAERRLFTRLGRVPGPDFDAYAAAHLLGTDLGSAERLLESLLGHSLLLQRQVGRYRFHDLVGAYARAESGSERSAGEPGALARLLDYYEGTARRADLLLAHHTVPCRPGRSPVPHPAPGLPDRSAALAWTRTELDNILAALAQAADDPARVAAMTGTISSVLQQEGPWPQALVLHTHAVEAAQVLEDKHAEAHARWNWGRVHFVTGAYPAALEDLRRALALYRQCGEPVGEANALWDLGRALQTTGTLEQAAEMYERALPLYRSCGEARGEVHVLHELGRIEFLTGRLPAAAAHQEQALKGYRAARNPLGEANALTGLGRTLQAAGDADAALQVFEQALAIYRTLGNRLGQANVLGCLGRLMQARGESAGAGDLFQRALDHYLEIGGRQGEANTLHDLGRTRQDSGDTTGAAELYRRAEELFRELGDPHGTAQALNSSACLVVGAGRPADALPRYRQALALARRCGSRAEEARALEGIGTALAALDAPA